MIDTRAYPQSATTEDTRIHVTRSDDTSLVRVSGELTFAATVRLRLTLLRQCGAATTVTVDLSQVPQLDPSATSVLGQADERLARTGGGLRVIGVGPVVLQTLDAAGLTERLRAHEPPRPPTAPHDGAQAPAPAEATPQYGGWGDEINAVISTLARLPESDATRRALRTRLVEMCLPHAHRLARRFTGYGEPVDDLNQVAALGLLKAINGFDPAFATDFGTYATPTIVGELKRHFRDRGWSIRVPRRLQELRLDINKARETLTQHLGRSPTPDEVAEHLDVDPDHVVEALVAAEAYRTTSIDVPVDAHTGVTMAERLGGDDPQFAAVEHRESLRPLLAALPPRDQQILSLRFFGNQSQTQIAHTVGISQMHVSRLLTRMLAQLRHGLLSDGEARPA